jgi:hypothetical protein
MVKPSCQRKMAHQAVAHHALVFVWLVKHLVLVKPATASKPNSAMTMQ